MERQTTGLKLNLGDTAPYFNLPATDGKRYSLNDFANSRAFAVIFTCNHCPYVQGWDGRLLELHNHFQAKGLQIVAICSNDPEGYPEDAFEQMVKKSERQDFAFPYLHDESQEVAKAYDAACTPEVYLFGSSQELVYHGRIDDNHADSRLADTSELKDAIVAVLGGRAPAVPLTPALGCSIKWRP